MLNGFNCGYNTSSIAESSNSRLKMLLPSHSLSLTDIRIALSSAEHLSLLSKQFIRERKTRRIKDSMLINIMEKFDISENIANSICNAIIKAQDLKYDVLKSEPEVLAHIEEVDDSFEPDLQEKFIVNKDGCTCKRFEHTGIPCKHYIRFLIEMNMNILDNINVSDRWKSKDEDSLIDHHLIEDLEQTKVVCIDAKDKVAPNSTLKRYKSFKATCFSIMKIASISQEKFQIAKEAMDSLEQKLTINLANWNSKEPCKICNKLHSTKKCPRREELLKFIQPNSYTSGKHHCSICGVSDHNASNCSTKAAWLKAINDGILDPL